jgi:hypothetical protein
MSKVPSTAADTATVNIVLITPVSRQSPASRRQRVAGGTGENAPIAFGLSQRGCPKISDSQPMFYLCSQKGRL